MPRPGGPPVVVKRLPAVYAMMSSLRCGDGGCVVEVALNHARIVDEKRIAAHHVVDEMRCTITMPGDVRRDGFLTGDIPRGLRDSITDGHFVPQEALGGSGASTWKSGLHLPLDAHPFLPFAFSDHRTLLQGHPVGADVLCSLELIDGHQLRPVTRRDHGVHLTVVRHVIVPGGFRELDGGRQNGGLRGYG